MTRRALVAQAAALCCLCACAAPTQEPTPSATPSAASSAAIASVDISPLRTSTGAELPAGEPSKINCTVDGRRAARWTATYADGTTSHVDVQLPTHASGQTAWQSVPFAGDGWMMAIVPGDVQDLDVVADVVNEGGFYSVGAGPLAAIDSTCLAIRYDTAADAAKVQGLVWRAPGGVFRKDSGAAVPSVDVTVENDRLSIYGDATLDVFGLITTSGSAISYKPSRTKDPFPCVLFSTTQREDGRWRTYFVGVLPPGSTNVKMTFRTSASKPILQTVAAETGEVFLVAEAGTSARTGEIFSTITYTDVDGKQIKPRWS